MTTTTTHFGAICGTGDMRNLRVAVATLEMRVNRWLRRHGYPEVTFDDSPTVHVTHNVDLSAGLLHTVVTELARVGDDENGTGRTVTVREAETDIDRYISHKAEAERE